MTVHRYQSELPSIPHGFEVLDVADDRSRALGSWTAHRYQVAPAVLIVVNHCPSEIMQTPRNKIPHRSVVLPRAMMP